MIEGLSSEEEVNKKFFDAVDTAASLKSGAWKRSGFSIKLEMMTDSFKTEFKHLHFLQNTSMHSKQINQVNLFESPKLPN